MPLLPTNDWKVVKNTDETSPLFNTLTFTFWLKQNLKGISTGRVYNKDIDEDRLDNYTKKTALYDDNRLVYYEKLYEHSASVKKITRDKTVGGWYISVNGYTFCFTFMRIATKDPPKQHETYMTCEELHEMFGTTE